MLCFVAKMRNRITPFATRSWPVGNLKIHLRGKIALNEETTHYDVDAPIPLHEIPPQDPLLDHAQLLQHPARSRVLKHVASLELPKSEVLHPKLNNRPRGFRSVPPTQ